MFDLRGSEFTPTKAIFTPTFPEVSNNIIDLGELASVGSDLFLPNVSLGDDDIVVGTNYTLAKRSLYAEFVACQMGPSSNKLKSASSSKLKSVSISNLEFDALAKDGNDVEIVCALLPMKIEKE